MAPAPAAFPAGKKARRKAARALAAQRAAALAMAQKAVLASGSFAEEFAGIEAVAAHHGNNHEVLVARFSKRDRAPMFDLVGTLEFEAVSEDRRVLDAQQAGDREPPHVGVDDRHVPAPAGQRHRQVGGDRRLAHAALARGDEQHAGLAAGVGEGDHAALGVAVGVLAAGGGGRVAVELGAQRRPLVVGHDREVEVDRVDPVERPDRAGDPVGDLGPQGAAGDREGHRHPDVPAVDGDAAHHVEVDDAAVQLGVFDGAEGLDDLVFGDGHDAPGGSGTDGRVAAGASAGGRAGGAGDY